MLMIERFGIGCACATALVLAGSAPAGEGDERTLADILETSSENVRLYNEHVVTLANPVMEGRVPGSRGMELAKEYCEFWFRDAGLTPPFAIVDKGDDGSEVVTPNASWRQPFELGGDLEALTAYWVQVENGAIAELTTAIPATGINDTVTWNFTTVDAVAPTVAVGW